MGTIPISKIHDAIVLGIEKAQQNYIKWSGGDWLSWAPEYIQTCYIAEKLDELEGSKYVTLESGVKYTLSTAGAWKKGRLSNRTRPDGRFDIIVWRGNEYPRAIIEVKRSVYTYRKVDSDINRIHDVLKKNYSGSSLQFGALAFYSDAKDNSRNNGRDILENRINLIFQKAKIQVDGNLQVRIKYSVHSDEEWHWCACCLVLKPTE
jgi:hypothetical protein